MSRLHHHEPVMPQRSRLLALPLVLLCALAYLGSATHFALVRHSTCPVHGELVHGEVHGEVHGHGDGPRRTGVSFDDARIAASQELQAGHRADVHCSHSFLRRSIPLPAGRVLSLSAVPVPGQVLKTAILLEEPQVAWLHLAPKASPPRG